MTTTIQDTTVDTADVDRITARVDKANRRAAKLGLPEYHVVLGHAEPRPITQPDPFNPGHVRVVGYVNQTKITVEGETPKVDGWEFVGTLDFDDVSGALVIRWVPGLEVDGALAEHRPVAKACDHCRVERYRNTTYLLRHDDGSFKQVGSTCIQDFLGIEVNLYIYDDVFGGDEEDEGWGGYGGGGQERLVIEQVLVDTLACVRAFGWVSAGVARDYDKVSTRSRLNAASSREADYEKGRLTFAGECRQGIAAQHQDTDADLAVEILRWVREDLGGNSEYVLNLKAAVAASEVKDCYDYDEDIKGYRPNGETYVLNTCTGRNLGLVVSAVSAYQREVEKQAEQAKTADRPPSEFVGAVKERLRGVTGTVDVVRHLDSDWGTTTLLIWSDAEGNQFKWFASGYKSYNVGDSITLDGTVKAHEIYNGVKATTLTRCKEAS